MDSDIIKEYLKYKKSKTENIIKFFSKIVKYAKTSWIEILSCRYVKEDDYLYSFYNFSEIDECNRFKAITCRLYKRTLNPKYPDYEMEDKELYCNALTWHTATQDIEQQKKNGEKGFYWKIAVCEPEYYVYKHWRELKNNINWKEVSKELHKNLHSVDAKIRDNAKKEICEKYPKQEGLFKNFKVEYFCKRS